MAPTIYFTHSGSQQQWPSRKAAVDAATLFMRNIAGRNFDSVQIIQHTSHCVSKVVRTMGFEEVIANANWLHLVGDKVG